METRWRKISMTLRHPDPLNEKEWNRLMRLLKKEEENPDPKRLERLRQAKDNASKIRVHK